MAQEIKIAKLLTRTGLKSSLPQPLSPGEFGTALDSKEVFIGLNPTNTSANNALPIINCYASVVDSQTYANQLISTYLFQVTLADPGIDNAVIDAANDDNVTAGFTRRYIKVTNRLYISYEYKYTGSVLDIPVLPDTGLGTEAVLSTATGVAFVNNSFDLSLLGTYTWQDTSAIASLINFAFTPSSGIKSGLVNVEQNLRILTELDLMSQPNYVPVGQILAPAATVLFSLAGSALGNNAHYVVDLIVSAVNQASGNCHLSQFKVFVSKATGNASISFIDRYYADPSALIDSTGTSGILISASVSNDGSSLTVSVESAESDQFIVAARGKLQ